LVVDLLVPQAVAPLEVDLLVLLVPHHAKRLNDLGDYPLEVDLLLAF